MVVYVEVLKVIGPSSEGWGLRVGTESRKGIGKVWLLELERRRGRLFKGVEVCIKRACTGIGGTETLE